MTTRVTVGEYLIQQLKSHGVDHVFGVPGDFVIKFMDLLAHSDVRLVNTCDEQGAGFAADAYARLRGLGVVCVTYGVGGLKVANSTAQAFAERSPVVVISGSPGIEERQAHPLIHHRIRDFDTQQRVFEQMTSASTVLDNPDTALEEIDRVLAAALRYKRPVYIELPRDMVGARGRHPHARRVRTQRSDPESLSAALAEAQARLEAARQPVVLAGEELHRFRLQDTFLEFIRRANLPIAATILGKSVIDEDHPCFLGIYQGGIGREEVRRYVETSDCVLMLGVMMTDVNLGIFTARLDRARCVHAVSEKLSVGYHVYEDVLFADFMAGLACAELNLRPTPPLPPAPAPRVRPADPGRPVTAERLFDVLNAFLTDDFAVVADPGDALFGAADLTVHRSTSFLSPAYYNSLGFAVPASVGVQMADPGLRPLVLVGDGAFQMTGVELSTAARFGLNPIVIVLNNGGYVTERYILDGPFNDVQTWDYSRLPEVVGAGRGFVVRTEDELEAALRDAAAWTEGFCLLDVRLDTMDATPTLRRLAGGLAKRR